MLVNVNSHISGPEHRNHYVKIYTKQNQRQYEKYIFMLTSNQNAWSINSDNLWFPMTSGRQVFVKVSYAHTGTVHFDVNVIGYR